MSRASTAAWEDPSEFESAVHRIKEADIRSGVVVNEIPAPTKIAPHAFALSADVKPEHGDDHGSLCTGRFVLLYDEDEPDAWQGRFRIVCFAQAPLETEIGADPFISDVAWAWLIDALQHHDSEFTAASGTATRIMSTGYGELEQQGHGAQVELRASWTPLGTNFASHVQSWAEVLCMLAGLPPHDNAENVSLLSARRNARA